MNAKSLIITIITLTVLSLSAPAQPAIEWEATHSINMRSVGWSAIQVSSLGQPGYVVCGEQAPNSAATDYDGVLWKVDPAGVTLWSLVFTSANMINESCHSVVEDMNHNLVAGGTYGGDMWIVKVDPTGGGTSFNLHYGNPTSGEECWSIQTTYDGGYILGGYASGFGSGKDFYLLKTDVNGAFLWDAHWNNSGNDVCYSVLEIAPNQFIVAGTTQGGGHNRGYLARYDYPGGLVWQKIYHNPLLPGEVMIYSVDRAPGGYILGGETNCIPPGDYDGLLIKTDNNGNRLWGKVYVGCPAEGFRSAKYSSIIPDSGYIAAGKVLVPEVSCYSAGLAVRTNLGGIMTGYDYYSFSAPLPQSSNSVAITSDAGAILGGTRRISTGDTQNDRMHLIKLAPALDCTRQGGEGDPGMSQTSVDFFNMTAPASEATLSPEAIPLQVGPNPFNPTTTISFQLPAAQHVKLAVYDLAGRLVSTLVNGQREAGTHQVTFDGSNLTSGVYLYSLTAGNYSSTGKMVLVK